jgi:hypothetical protein
LNSSFGGIFNGVHSLQEVSTLIFFVEVLDLISFVEGFFPQIPSPKETLVSLLHPRGISDFAFDASFG